MKVHYTPKEYITGTVSSLLTYIKDQPTQFEALMYNANDTELKNPVHLIVYPSKETTIDIWHESYEHSILRGVSLVMYRDWIIKITVRTL